MREVVSFKGGLYVKQPFERGAPDIEFKLRKLFLNINNQGNI